MRGCAREGCAPAAYPLTSTVRLDLSSADFFFLRSQSRRLSSSTRCIGGGRRNRSRFQRNSRFLSNHGGAHAPAHRSCVASARSALRRPSRPSATRMPTPNPARHRAHPLHASRLGIPGSPHDRGATLTLLSLIPARIPRSLAGPDCSRCRIGSRDPSAGGSARLMALGHRAHRPQARPLVRPPTCHASTPPAGPHCPLSCTFTRPLPLAPLTARLRLLQGSSLQPFGLRASPKALSSSPIHSRALVGGAVGSSRCQTVPLFSSSCAHVDGVPVTRCRSVARGCCRVHGHV